MTFNSWITERYEDRPTNCAICRKRFDDDSLFQREVQHEVIKYGESVGESLVNERYAEWHIDEHNDKQGPY